MDLFSTLNEWWISFSSSISSLVDFFSLPINDLINIKIPIVSQITDLLLSIVVGGTEEIPITLGDVSLFNFLLGSLMTLFIGITIVKWFIGIIT